MLQRGQVLRLKSKGRDGKPLWAYRYRLDGRGSKRLQRGGFATKDEAQEALNRTLDDLHCRNPLAEITFAELVEKYLAQHEVDPVTLTKLGWLLSKSVAGLGGRRVIDLRSDELAATGLLAYLERRGDLPDRLAAYLVYRAEEAVRLEAEQLREEDEALADLAVVSDVEIQRYGTKSADHHQSSKVMVATVEALARLTCDEREMEFDANPQSRAIVLDQDRIWVSPRRLDGALPSLLNPVAIWEIKEYWGVTGGGSKMSDAIYECQLVGQELRAFEDLHGLHMQHYVFLDGKAQWGARRSDLRRAIDLLSMGLVDELVVGREVLSEWPRIVGEMCGLAAAKP